MATDAIRDLLADMFTDTITAYPVISSDARGKLVTSGSISITCRVSEKNRLIRNSTGQEVVSSFKVICNEVNNLSVPRSTNTGWEGHLFSLASTEKPGSLLTPESIVRPRDDNGIHHEVIYFL